MALHLRANGGFGVQGNQITRHAAFYTTAAHRVAWMGRGNPTLALVRCQETCCQKLLQGCQRPAARLAAFVGIGMLAQEEEEVDKELEVEGLSGCDGALELVVEGVYCRAGVFACKYACMSAVARWRRTLKYSRHDL